MTTDKRSVQALVQICHERGLRDVVFSPGSRNAPLVIAFSEHGGYTTRVVADERVAAFYALGQGLATGIPTVICCTSGTAGLNYAPAIAEAYYQEVPMLILTADRPVEFIDMGLGQSMRQKDMYHNYIKQSNQIIQAATTQQDLIANEKVIRASIAASQLQPRGPVHINMPFSEPLYGKGEVQALLTTHEEKITEKELDAGMMDEISVLWQSSRRKMILLGQHEVDARLITLLDRLVSTDQVVLLTETTSNFHSTVSQNVISCIDKVLAVAYEDAGCTPDLLVSLGGAVVSKRIKSYLTENKPEHHIICCHTEIPRDTFRAMTHHVRMDSEALMEVLVSEKSENKTSYNQRWQAYRQATETQHKQLVVQSPYSDLKVFNYILSQLSVCVLHMANSTPIRYAQLFENKSLNPYYCNRGVCGIDGSTSTALGYASKSDKLNVLITGDVSFFYDSNAFWINELPKNLKLILINNGGGNIFRYIGGPDTSNQLDVFESPHNLRAEHLCKLYDLSYHIVTSYGELAVTYPEFIKDTAGRIQLLEIITPGKINAEVLRDYFDQLKALPLLSSEDSVFQVDKTP